MTEFLSFSPKTGDCDFDRIDRLQSRMNSRSPSLCPERAEIATRVYAQTQGEPIVLRRAKAFSAVLNEMTIYLETDSLIIGNQARSNFAAPVFPEYSFNWVIRELDELEHRSGDYFNVSDDTKARLRVLQEFWLEKTHQDEVARNLPDAVREAVKQNVLHCGGISMSGDGHIIPNHDFVLSAGYGGIARNARERLDTPDLAQDQKDFYQAVIIANEAALCFIKRYSKLASEEAKSEPNEKRRRELLALSEMLAGFMESGARSFHEAVQAIYMTHLLMMIESNGHSFSFGRFDQYVYPFYKSDIESGAISEEKALEIITHFFIMTNSLNKVRPWNHTQYSCGYPLYSNLMVGGMKPDGTDGTNEISYLCLEAMNMSRLPEPNLSVRFWEKTPRRLLVDSARLIRKGFGMPSMFCDEVVIPAMMTLDIDIETARDYASIGCVETGIPGKWGHRATGMTYINFGKVDRKSVV